MEGKAASTQARPISLKWQAIVLFAIVIAITYGLISLISYWHFQSQFERQRETFRSKQIRELNSLTSSSAEKLNQLAETITLLQNVKGNGLDLFSRRLDQYWVEMQLIWDLELLQLYDADGKLSWARGRAGKAPLDKWVAQALQEERPNVNFHCDSDCIQIISVPFIHDGQKKAVLVIGRNLLDFLLEYHTVADITVGIISPSSSDSLPATRLLPAWGMQIKALTDISNTTPILRAATADHSFEQVRSDGASIEYKQRHYELQLIPVSAANITDAYFVVIQDTTEPLARIQDSTHRTLLTGMFGFIWATGLLALILWSVATRVSRVTSSLPLLAKRSYDGARELLSHSLDKRRWKDEIDILADTAVDLAYQLEKLETDIDYHSERIAVQHQELAKERDFVTSLLSHAQAIILTQDPDGRITLINRFGSELLGMSEHQLMGMPFSRFIPDETERAETAACLQRLYDNSQSAAQQETTIRCKDGELRTVSWFHSRLQYCEDEEPLVLSVGLDLTGRKEAEEKLAWLADHDELTGLFNRRRFQEEVSHAIQLASRYNHQGALLYLDLDQFKYINDTSGHQAGDHLLKLIADKIDKSIRASDIAARVGGDEFAIILHQITPQYAQQIALKLSNALKEMEFRLHVHQHRISASIGIALFPLHGSSVYDLMANADLAMYQAKQQGHGRVHLFSENEQAREQMQQLVIWKHRIEQALAQQRFIFHYQPILNIKEGTVSHYEALLRMVDEDGTIHPPGTFIGVAEQTGLIREIDHYVLREGIAALADWTQKAGPVTFALNLSGTMMDAVELLPMLRQQIKRSGIDPGRLIFEVTETAAVLDMDAARHMMEDIKSLGCRFALDDFGVGLSSFSYLQQLPVDYIKIDGTFIRDLANRRDNQLFVQALVQVAQGLGRKTVAEFVEDQATLEILDQLDVDFAQGFHIGRPMPELLAKGKAG